MVSRRNLLLGAAVVATLAAVVWSNGSEEEIAAPSVHERRSGDEVAAPRKGKSAPVPPELSLDALESRALGDMKADLFAAKSWYVPPPPPPPPPPAPPPKPIAPPLPFTFLGRLIEGQHAAVFVSVGDRNQVLRVGDIVDRVWRVDAIDNTRMAIVYLPLNENKYLDLGAAP